MKDDLKGKLAKLFDSEGCDSLPDDVERALRDDKQSENYFKRLSSIENSLREPSDVHIPKGFTNSVMKRLPEKSLKEPRIFQARDIFMPLLLVSAVILALIFSQPLGLNSLVEMVSSYAESGEEIDMQIVFIVITSAGILFSTWLIVTNFFGIRSRRVFK